MQRVKVKKIEIINFKGIEHLELDFTYLDSDRVLDNIVFYGINGSGKSTVLEAINISLIISAFYTVSLERDDVEGILINYLSLGKEWIYDKKEKFTLKIEITYNQKSMSTLITFDRNNHLKWESNVEKELMKNEPFTYLSSYRLLNPSMVSQAGDWNKIDEMEKDLFLKKFRQNLQQENSFPTLNLQFSNNYTTVKQYLVNLIIDKKVGTLSTKNSEILEKIHASFKIFFPNKEFLEQLSREGDVQDYRLMIKNEDNSIVDLDQLSSGEREIIAFFTYLCTQAIGKSIIIIDEPELHLHDKWQSIILYAIHKVFPNIQLFLATHSETIHQSVSESELFELVK